ncbi:MAG: hypothetical protein H3Z54_03545 [archaeon]|nr:hypothetical protein [archaeon]
MFEADEWTQGTTHVEEGTGSFNLIALFKGDIRDGKFIGLPRLQGRGAGPNPRKLRVHIDGDPDDKYYTLEISEDTGEQEGELLEIVFCVSGTIDGVKKEYKDCNPVFVRLIPDRRPVITFITGHDAKKGNPFFGAATQYFEHLADGIIPPPKQRDLSFEEILDYLDRPIRKGKHVINPPWGEVNIVTHGTNYGRRKDGSNCDFCEIFSPLFPNGDRITAGLLKRNSGNPRLRADKTKLDEDSIIVIRGCEIGDDQVLLDELRRLFGGRATVIAPRPIQKYAPERPKEPLSEGNPTRESFLEYFFFYVPGSKSPDQNKTKEERKICIGKLREKYPDRNSDDQWTEMLNSDLRHDRNTEQVTLRVLYPSIPEKNKDFLGDAENVFNQTKKTSPEEIFFSDFKDWEWHRQGPFPLVYGGEKKFECRFTGRRYRVDVRRVLNDSKGSPVIPVITDPTYYGRSEL